MGDEVGRSTLFGIPLQQTWSHENTGDFAPTYYLQTDAPLYYYSFTDAFIAMAYRSLHAGGAGALRPDDHRLQPRRHVRGRPHPARAADLPGRLLAGSASSPIHKEFVSAKVAGETASLTNPALDRILDFAAEAGLVVILHNDIDMPFAEAGAGARTACADEGPLPASPEDHDHLGAHRARPGGAPGAGSSSASDRRTGESCSDPATCAHVYFDISWDEVAKYVVATPEAIAADGRRASTSYPDRFLFGTDDVAPTDQATYLQVYQHVRAALWRRADAGGERRSSARATTSGCSTRRGAACGRGSRRT